LSLGLLEPLARLALQLAAGSRSKASRVSQKRAALPQANACRGRPVAM
jgi:hypothetical protein